MHQNDQLPHLYVFSGAGLSASSGLHTYRDSGGIWTKYNPDRVCYLPAFKNHREESFAFMGELLEHIEAAKPNASHLALAELSKQCPGQVLNLTQNVDDLLERAGCDHVVHLHGDLLGYNCFACGHEWRRTTPKLDVSLRCPECSSARCVKPSVVMFGEPAPQYAVLSEIKRQAQRQDVLLSVGTAFEVLGESDVVPPRLKGSTHAIEVNLQLCAKPEYFGTRIQGKADDVLPELLKKLTPYLQGRDASPAF